MSSSPDFPRARLCQLAAIERSRHARWQRRGLLPQRTRYTAHDAALAGALDQVRLIAGLEIAERIWIDLKSLISADDSSLLVVIDLETAQWVVARTATELWGAVGRDGRFGIADIGGRIATIRERVEGFARAL